MYSNRHRFILLLTLFVAWLVTCPGCQWYDQLRGPGFAGWEESNGFRGKNPEARGSGLVTSRKGEQIEKSLGGDY